MKYFCYYDVDHPKREKRASFLAATNKINYIVRTISCHEEVEIISCGTVLGKKSDRGHCNKIYDKVSLKVYPSIGRKNRLLGKSSTLFARVVLLYDMLHRVRKGEKIIVYHSLGYMKIIQLAKKLKKFRLILEVEEIYADVVGNAKLRKKEMSFFCMADGFIFPTHLLSDEINKEKKPEVIIHGTYQVEPSRKCSVFEDNLQMRCDQIVHCVYAGTLDPRKGGAVAAAAAAEFLPENYHIHIIGFGSEKEIHDMKVLIFDISSRSKAKVTYDGLLSGEEYIRFIQSCDIGLSTQNPDAAFNATSFPSKILSYMANGLQVVSIRIPAIESSAIGENVFYYDKQSPEQIAKAICSVDLKSKDVNREYISKLDVQFLKDIKRLIDV